MRGCSARRSRERGQCRPVPGAPRGDTTSGYPVSAAVGAQFDPTQVQHFIGLTYPAAVAGKLHISSTGDYVGQQFDRADVDGLTGYVRQLDQGGRRSIYLRVTTDRPGLGAGKRGGAADSVELVGLWSDLDFGQAGHNHDPSKHDGLVLPPNEQSAREIVEVAALPEPTVWIHSGGGLYAWWLTELAISAAEVGLGALAQLSQRWQGALGAGAKSLDFHYGTGVSDLARVLRLPGTVNRKVTGDPRPCRILSDDGPRYSLDALRSVLDAAEHVLGIGQQKRKPAPLQAVAGSARPTAAQFMESDAGKLWAPVAPGTGSPFDDFETRTDWADILCPVAWIEVARQSDGTRQWVRPGKDSAGISATTGRAHDRDRMWNFSDNAGLPVQEPMTKPYVYAFLNHGGDMQAAAAALYAGGYGARDQGEEMGATARRSYEGRPGLHVGSPAIAAEWLRENIGRGHLAGMFLRGGGIVHTPREGEDGYIPITDDKEDGPAQVRPVTAAGLAARIQYTYHCYREKKTEVSDGAVGDKRTCMFPLAAAKVPIEAPDMLPHLRILRGVVHSPMVRADGSILAGPGYDQATRLLHLPQPGLHVPPIPECPTEIDTVTAVALVGEMLADFPFCTESDRANYVGLALTPLLRELVPPPYKLGAIGAPQPGSGKSLLATILRILHGGVFRSEIPANDAELSKQISTILDVTTAPVVQFDNVSGVLRSSTLSGLLTATWWDDRRLGSNTQISRPNDRLWIVTGNNLALGGDIPRRAVRVTIDPGRPNPQLRTGFAIANLEGWVMAHRGELIAALLTMIRAWVVAGRPTTSAGSDNFAPWIEAVSGILAVAGVSGTFDAPETARAAVGVDDEEWGEFLATIHGVFGEQVWTVKELLACIDTSGAAVGPLYPGTPPRPRIPLDALPTELAERAARSHTGVSVIAKSLGRWLVNRDGRWAGGLAVRSDGQDRTNVKLWRIETPT